MKKLRKVTDKALEELLSLRNNRKSIDQFIFSFLGNFYENCRVMHSLIPKEKNDDVIYKTAYRQYFVFLVSCWETYFRDVFVYIHSSDDELTTKLIEKMKINIDADNDLDIDLPELLAKSFNFQNINDLEKAYNELLGEGFLSYVCSSAITPCGVNGDIFPALCLEHMIPDWRDSVDTVFSIRHKVVHDANFRPEIDIKLIQTAELVFLLIPQFSTYILSLRFKLPLMLLCDGEKSAPYIFSVREILADDWRISD